MLAQAQAHEGTAPTNGYGREVAQGQPLGGQGLSGWRLKIHPQRVLRACPQVMLQPASVLIDGLRQ
jgi:hypothetical protein